MTTEVSAPNLTAAQVWATLAGGIEAGLPAPESATLFERHGLRPWVTVHLHSVEDARTWGRWVGATEPWILHIPANRHTNYEWAGYRGGWQWKFSGNQPDTEAVVSALLDPDALPEGVDGVHIGGRT